MSSTPAPSLVVDCSVPGVMDNEQIKEMRKEAMVVFERGEVEAAKNIMDEVKRMEGVLEQGRESLVELEGEALEQWHKDQEAGAEVVLQDFRSRRNSLLAASDWSLLPDVPLTDAQKKDWREYRQTLRDLPANADHTSEEFEWPVPPDAA